MSRLYTIGSSPGAVVRPLLPSLPSHDPNTESRTRLVDAFGRRLTYLRVSVTDRCNLRCTYCLPEDAEFPFGDRDFLSPAEIETIVGSLVRLGIRRVRLTGGPPEAQRRTVRSTCGRADPLKTSGVDRLSSVSRTRCAYCHPLRSLAT